MIVVLVCVKHCTRQLAVANIKCQCAFLYLQQTRDLHALQNMNIFTANPCRQIVMIARTQVAKGE